MTSTNLHGLTQKDYIGAKSTLSTGCGHDSITSNLIKACFQADIDPGDVIKISGIGCSSKTPTYFMNQSFGFNSIHGRMAPLATGALVANKNLQCIGISGDGDSASIGIGGFLHMIRRNLPIIYIIENNSVYGLTKGQLSATADSEMHSKSGEGNPFTEMDLCALAIQLECPFVARSFSGDNKQLVSLLKAAFSCQGTAIIDIVSPCVTFANHDSSTKSFSYVKTNKSSLHDLGFIPAEEEISADYEPGTDLLVEMHDGSHLVLKKKEDYEYDISNKIKALEVIEQAHQEHKILTGLFYWNPKKANLFESLDLPETPLRDLDHASLSLTEAQLESLQNQYR